MTTEARPLEGLRSSSIALLGRRRIPQEAIILAITIALALTIFFFKPKFLSFYNLESVVRIASIYGIVAIGMTLVIISGGVDLSAGAVMALGGAVSAGLLGQAFGAANPVALPVYASLSLALAVGALVGAITTGS